MKKTIEVDVFKFTELDGKAKDRAQQWLSEVATDHDWWEFVYDAWKEKLEEQGYDDPNIQFSGFWSQGDGASFSATVDVAKWIWFNKASEQYPNVLRVANEVGIGVDIRTDSRAVHEYSMTISSDLWSVDDEAASAEWEKFDLDKVILEDARQLARQIYKDLKKEYYSITSDEALADLAEGNNWFFTSSGSRFVHI